MRIRHVGKSLAITCFKQTAAIHVAEDQRQFARVKWSESVRAAYIDELGLSETPASNKQRLIICKLQHTIEAVIEQAQNEAALVVALGYEYSR
jgi:hypothetical protein